MKFYFKHPNGWEFSFQREPVDRDKLYAICISVAVCVVVLAFFSIFK